MATQRSGTTSSRPDDAAASADGSAPVRIKKYANRRLYNTASSSYVTLEHLAQMVRDGQEFVVHDAKTGDDITRAVLTQIIVEEESKGGQNMLPIGFLRQLISLYGDNMQWMVPKYLERSLEAFAENQERMRTYMQSTMTGMFPYNPVDEVGRQNMALFEQAMKMFTPFPTTGAAGGGSRSGSDQASDDKEGPKPTGDSDYDPLLDMQRRLGELQRQMETLNQMSSAMGGGADKDKDRATPPDSESSGNAGGRRSDSDERSPGDEEKSSGRKRPKG